MTIKLENDCMDSVTGRRSTTERALSYFYLSSQAKAYSHDGMEHGIGNNIRDVPLLTGLLLAQSLHLKILGPGPDHVVVESDDLMEGLKEDADGEVKYCALDLLELCCVIALRLTSAFDLHIFVAYSGRERK